ncbi:DNA helicase PIF1, ATP-dependent [Tanacetum coccineum]
MGLAASSMAQKRATKLKGKAVAIAPNVAPPETGCKRTGAASISKRTTADRKGKAIADPNNVATTKTGRTTTVDGTIVGSLIRMLDANSAIAKAFWMARDWCHADATANVELRLLSERIRSKQYNAPTVAEVAALITNDFGDGEPTRDILVCKKDSPPKRISELHPSYMALQYPLLFPYGEDGYHEKIPKDEWTTLHRGGRLFQQYLVDAFTAIEEQRLSWTRNNQDTLRVDLYHNVVDAITRGDKNAAGLGKRIVLPISFTGGPRYMMQNYQDAMALCRAYGNPDLFITFTSNPKWPEINEMLAYIPGQRAHDRPEVGTREFKLKLTELLDDLTKNHVFGATRADYMLHGPCGMDNRAATCNLEGKCSKHFLKPFYVERVIDEDGYPIYRRRDDKVSVKKANFTFDNKHVVPHNRYLLLKYQAYINVEWCNRSKAIKYLFKYLNKGPDRATIVIQENVQQGQSMTEQKVTVVDQIKNYLNCRYLAPCEANQQHVTLHDTDCLPTLLQKKGIDVTMFTDWFDLNERHPPARTLTIVYSTPSAGERYFLRMLLNIARGPQKFEHLLIVNGRICSTFKEACFAYGLLNDDKEWTREIQEASLWALDLFNTNGRALREFSDMPQPNPTLLTSVDNRLIREARAFDMNKSRIQHQQLYPQLNPKQRLIYKEVVDSVHNKKGQFHFVYGTGGTGKMFLYKTIISRLRSELKIVLVVASSGIASLLLPGGRTAHSRQILPVIPKGKRADIVQACINHSELWKHCKVSTLKRSMRVNEYTSNDDIDTQKQTFNQWVLAVGDGKVPAIIKNGEDEPTWIEIPKIFLIPLSESPIQQIVEETYPNFIQRQKDDAYLRERAILTPRNDDANAINAYMFDKLAGEECNKYEHVGQEHKLIKEVKIKMIQVKEMMQDNDLKNSKSKDKGSKLRSQSMDEQSHYKQDKTITRQSINVKRHIFNVIGDTEEFEERDLNIGGDC